ncbi:hypothetical protein PFISCL1PPCAC_10812, partial [Pristionchus fissidentatus]
MKCSRGKCSETRVVKYRNRSRMTICTVCTHSSHCRVDNNNQHTISSNPFHHWQHWKWAELHLHVLRMDEEEGDV